MNKSHPITLRRGDSFNLEVVYTVDDVPFDLTDYTADFGIRLSLDKTRVRTHTIDPDRISITPAEGKIAIELVPGDTRPIAAGIAEARFANGNYQLRIEGPNGARTTLLSGIMTVLPNHIKELI